MSKHEIGPFCLIGTQRGGIYVRHVRRTDVSERHHALLFLNVFRVSYCASFQTGSPESLVMFL